VNEAKLSVTFNLPKGVDLNAFAEHMKQFVKPFKIAAVKQTASNKLGRKRQQNESSDFDETPTPKQSKKK
jgi:hypothetical protein